MNELCKHHEAINVKLERFEKHCDESDEPKTGYRDRLVNVEATVKELKAGVYKAAIIGGLIGALSGQAMPELMGFIAKRILGG
jgi:hypothetical protein